MQAATSRNLMKSTVRQVYTNVFAETTLKFKASCRMREPHNHPPLPDPPINPDVKERLVSHMRVGASPANVHKQLVKEAPLPLSSADVPTPGIVPLFFSLWCI
jgi:hypothetical protein